MTINVISKNHTSRFMASIMPCTSRNNGRRNRNNRAKRASRRRRRRRKTDRLKLSATTPKYPQVTKNKSMTFHGSLNTVFPSTAMRIINSMEKAARKTNSTHIQNKMSLFSLLVASTLVSNPIQIAFAPMRNPNTPLAQGPCIQATLFDRRRTCSGSSSSTSSGKQFSKILLMSSDCKANHLCIRSARFCSSVATLRARWRRVELALRNATKSAGKTCSPTIHLGGRVRGGRGTSSPSAGGERGPSSM
mmetsp:Transcript_28312/g.64291  ORF Transcript_28312/g.64291 Transcript_28312/m.64291 type:complete len:248 (-) Transcript_28312:8-751(-)